MTEKVKAETDVLVRLMNEESRDGWRYSSDINDVPAEIGHYGLNDGLRGMGFGVTQNMRKSIELLGFRRAIIRPIYSWLPDADGSAALWLDGEIRCSRCPSKPIFSLNDIDAHGVEVHGDERERDY